MKVTVRSVFPIGFATAVQQVNRPALLEFVSSPLIRFEPISPAVFPEIWQQERYLVKMKFLNKVSMGKQYIGIEKIKGPDEREYLLRDNGSGELIKVWDHLITLRKIGEGRVFYQDEVKIKAGLLTPFVWLFALLFYHWRQLRWQKLIARNFQPLVWS